MSMEASPGERMAGVAAVPPVRVALPMVPLPPRVVSAPTAMCGVMEPLTRSVPAVALMAPVNVLDASRRRVPGPDLAGEIGVVGESVRGPVRRMLPGPEKVRVRVLTLIGPTPMVPVISSSSASDSMR